MRIAICDDEAVFRRILISALEEYAKENGLDFVYNEYSDGKLLLSDSVPHDIIFMDYQMKRINGLDTVGSLRKRNDDACVIFVSSYKEVVFDSMIVGTHRFLLKPLDKIKLKEALDSYISANVKMRSIVVKDEENDVMIRISEKSVIYAEAENIYCRIRTADNEYRYKKTLSHFEHEVSPEMFFRVNRSYLVNFSYIKRYSQTEIIFDNEERAILTKSKYHKFQKAYGEFLKRASMGLIK